MDDPRIELSERGIKVEFHRNGHCSDVVEFPAPELALHPDGVVCVECADAHRADPVNFPETGIYADPVEAWAEHTCRKFLEWYDRYRCSELVFHNPRHGKQRVRPCPQTDQKVYRSVSAEDEERGQQTDDLPWNKRDD